MNFLSDNLVYRRGQDYLRRRRERQDSRSRNRNLGTDAHEARHEEASATANVEQASSRIYPPPVHQKTRRGSLPASGDPGESADDEGDSSAMEAAEGDTDSTGGVAWKHTDRVLSARLSRQEQLEKEKGVVEDALRSSLSTLMMLQISPSTSTISTSLRQQDQALGLSRSPPSLSTSPSSTLTVRSSRPRDGESVSKAPTQTLSGKSLSQSTHSYSYNSVKRPSNLMERRRTYTPGTPTSSRQTATSARRREDPEWTDAAANVSSASSYEDLGKTSSNQEGSDLDIELTSSAGDEGLDRLGEASAPLRTRSSNASGVASPRRRRRPKRDRMQSLRRTAMGSRSKDGIQSDPEGQPSSERGADDSFLDLLEATKTFMAMHPRYSSTPRSTSLSSQLDQLAAQSMPVRLGREESTPRGRTIDLPCEAGAVQERVAGTDYHSPAPASMSASTNFDLSSSDSPPSHGLTSSRGGDEASKDDDEADPLATTPQPIASDPRLSSDASRDLATPRETGEAEKPPSRPLHESWLDWLGRHMRRVTVGISLVGLGVVLAVGVGLFRPPTIRRKYVLHNGIKHS